LVFIILVFIFFIFYFLFFYIFLCFIFPRNKKRQKLKGNQLIKGL